MGAKNCKADNDNDYFLKCIPETLTDISEENKARYRHYMNEWRKGNPEFRSTENILFGCNTREDYYKRDTGLVIDVINTFAGSTFEKFGHRYHDAGFQKVSHSYGTYNETVIYNYQKLRENMKKDMLIDDDILNEIWPAFYWNYQSEFGKKIIEELITRVNPGPLAERRLRQRRDNFIQTRFQLLNPPDLDKLKIGVGRVWGRTIPPDVDDPWSRPGTGGIGYGDPLWSENQRRFALRQAYPQWNGENFLDAWHKWFIQGGYSQNNVIFEEGGGITNRPGKENPFNVPGYTGNLPYAPIFAQAGQEPWHSVLTDPDAEGFDDPCVNRTVLEKYVPIGAAGVGALVGASVIPGGLGSLSAAVTLGGAAYHIVSATYGYEAFKRTHLENWVTGTKNKAPEFLGIGGPVTFVFLVDEVGLLPITGELPLFVGAAAAAGYFIVTPYLRDVAKIGDSAGSLMLAPISLIDKGITQLFNGCVTNRISTAGKCKCKDAAQKPQLIEAFVGPIFGTTGEQQTMRRRCLQGAMTRGLWGDDPVRIGDCRPDGTKSNPGACVSAGAWAYNTLKDDPLLISMHSEISHCLDIDNPSFLPPEAKDAPCSVHGPHFRMVNEKCVNLSAPKGLQDPGQWPDGDVGVSSNECVIL